MKKAAKKTCDSLWSDCIKARAGYKSEILNKKAGKQIGGDSTLHAHHIAGKPNYRLRYELDNGICLTSGEHKFGIHNQGRQKEYEEHIKKAKGGDIFERMEALKWQTTSGGLELVKLYLEQELKKLQGG